MAQLVERGNAVYLLLSNDREVAKIVPSSSLQILGDTSLGLSIAPTPSSTNKGLTITQSGHGSFSGTDTYNPNGLDLNGIYITSDDIDVSSHSIYGFHLNWKFGGAAATGQRLGFHSWLTQTAAMSPSAADDHRYYQAGQFTMMTLSGDGGTNTGAGSKGYYMPINVIVFSDGANVSQLCSTEFDVYGSAAATQRYVMGISLCSGHVNAGADIDAAIDIHSLGASGSSPVYGPGAGFSQGLEFVSLGGLMPIRSTGTLIGSYVQSGFGVSVIPVAYGVDLNNFTFTQKAFRSPGFSIAPLGQAVLGASIAGQATLNIPSGTGPTSALAGDIWNDGITLYVSGQAAQRGIIAARQFTIVQPGSNTALSNSSTGAQAIFAAATDTITLAAATTYMFRGLIKLNTGATSHTTSLGFSTSISADSFGYTAWTVSAAAGTPTAPLMTRVSTAGATVITAASTATSTDIYVEGFVRVVTAGTLTPQVTFSAGPTGTCEVAQDSYFEFIPVGSRFVTSTGPWA